MADGTIHLDFTSDGSFVNAIEITLASSASGAPIRMLAGPASFRDSAGNVWRPEEFFFGGRRTFHPDNLPRVRTHGSLPGRGTGTFVHDKEYTLRLYFFEGGLAAATVAPAA